MGPGHVKRSTAPSGRCTRCGGGKGLDNAEKQKAIATEQHLEADELEAKAVKLDALGETLVADAVEIKGATQVIQRGE